jgi:hypothetical protein
MWIASKLPAMCSIRVPLVGTFIQAIAPKRVARQPPLCCLIGSYSGIRESEADACEAPPLGRATEEPKSSTSARNDDPCVRKAPWLVTREAPSAIP